DLSIAQPWLVHGIVAPARATAIEESHVPIGIAFAMRKPAAEKPVATRKSVPGGRARALPVCDRPGHFRCPPLVGVEAKHPVVRGLPHREILLRAESRPV